MASVGGLGPLLGPMLAVLARSWTETWPKPKRERDPTGAGLVRPGEALEAVLNKKKNCLSIQ